jgi:D-3-phosphoglycerate dehydrogenase
MVNATLVAKERGVNVKEVKSENAENFSSLISVRLCSGKDAKTVAGTVFESYGERIVKIDDFSTDVFPNGFMLITSHTDKPGIIGRVGSLLGDANINIASMDVGRQSIGGKAVMVLSVDSLISEDMIKKVNKVEGITDTKLVRL